MSRSSGPPSRRPSVARSCQRHNRSQIPERLDRDLSRRNSEKGRAICPRARAPASAFRFRVPAPPQALSTGRSTAHRHPVLERKSSMGMPQYGPPASWAESYARSSDLAPRGGGTGHDFGLVIDILACSHVCSFELTCVCLRECSASLARVRGREARWCESGERRDAQASRLVPSSHSKKLQLLCQKQKGILRFG